MNSLTGKRLIFFVDGALDASIRAGRENGDAQSINSTL